MPFVRKTDSQGSQPSIDTRKLFIGRTGELLFFVQNILRPEEPTHNIISIWGQGGVGKSTLLSRFIDEAHSAEFKDYCLIGTVDELQTTSASIMEKFAAQLHMQDAFEKALKQYQKGLRTQQTEQETLQDTLVQKMPAFAGATVEGIPFVGPLLGEGVKATAEHLRDRHNHIQKRKEAEILEDPVNILTRAFVEELNQIVATRVMLASGKIKHRRVILCFDTFEQLAAEVVPWLLNSFLTADINASIVLIIAGRDPIERSYPEDTKRWLPYIDNENIYWIPLNSFTEDETRVYLTKRNITDPERISTIWQLSQGLPLYLSLLTSNPRGNVDPTADVVANFLRWIPEREYIKRQLALDTALFSHPFNQDDLTAFAYLPKNELPSLYSWLIAQPFVRSQDGRYTYHELAQELFGRHLYQRSKREYYATRSSIANYYQRLLEEIQQEMGVETYHLVEWLELVLALSEQLFILPGEASDLKAIELILKTFQHTDAEQNGEIANFMRELSDKQSSIPLSTGAQQAIKLLLQYIEAGRRSQERLTAASALLKRVEQSPTFSSEVRAQMYTDRGWVYLHLRENEQAISDFNSALALNPLYARAYARRGQAYRYLKDYQQAMSDYNRAIELNPQDTWSYERRGRMHRKLGNYRSALEDFDRIVELDSNYVWAYLHRGITYRLLKNYPQALAELDRALELRPHYASILAERGLTCLWMQNLKQAISDYTHSKELDGYYIQNHNNWMAIWAGMCYERPGLELIERLETIAATAPEHPVAFVCRGVAMWLLKDFDEALPVLEQPIQMASGDWDAYFWKGMVCASMGQEEEAIAAIERSLELELPPILLTPLRWFEQDRPDFYQKYVVPLMARYDLV
jgi:tetratricopeptide (TPR) repeat protein/GTPase SAR1 family protein